MQRPTVVECTFRVGGDRGDRRAHPLSAPRLVREPLVRFRLKQHQARLVTPLAGRMIRPAYHSAADRPGAEMRAAVMSITKGFSTYSEGMTLAAKHTEPGDPGACRRR